MNMEMYWFSLRKKTNAEQYHVFRMLAYGVEPAHKGVEIHKIFQQIGSGMVQCPLSPFLKLIPLL
jgi:hypothetical protein